MAFISFSNKVEQNRITQKTKLSFRVSVWLHSSHHAGLASFIMEVTEKKLTDRELAASRKLPG